MRDELLARIRAVRRSWVELDGTHALLFERPGLEDQFRLLDLKGAALVRAYLGMVKDWRGFTEADALPDGNPAVPLEFDAEVLEAMCESSDALLGQVLDALRTRRQHVQARQETERGN